MSNREERCSKKNRAEYPPYKQAVSHLTSAEGVTRQERPDETRWSFSPIGFVCCGGHSFTADPSYHHDRTIEDAIPGSRGGRWPRCSGSVPGHQCSPLPRPVKRFPDALVRHPGRHRFRGYSNTITLMKSAIQAQYRIPPSEQIRLHCRCIVQRPKNFLWHLRGICRAIPAMIVGFLIIGRGCD